ncbi:hypothetical protein GCM10027596_31850 [Nocardioides korecus]
MSESMDASQSDPLAEQLLRHAQLLSQLRRDLDETTNTVTDVAADVLSRVEDLETLNASGRLPSAWSWRNLGDVATKQLWQELTGWVDWLRSRYPLARKVPPCWSEHPEVVEELTALWLAWQYAYEERDAPLTAASDWHDRWLPGVLHRLEHGPFAVDCSEQHRRRPATAYAQT